MKISTWSRALGPERWELSRIDDLPISFTGISALLFKKEKEKKREKKKEKKLG